MIRQWIKILVLALVVLAQTACPRSASQSTNQGLESPTEQQQEPNMEREFQRRCATIVKPCSGKQHSAGVSAICGVCLMPERA